MELHLDPKSAYDKLSSLKAGALFMKIGSKKLNLAIDLAKSKKDEIDFVIWIAPASFFMQNSYTEDIKNFAGPLSKKICFYTIESISLSDNKYLQLYNLADKYRTFCIVDESLTIKNTEAGRTKRLLSICNKFKYRLILSSIPLTQGLIDLYSQLEFIDSNILRMNESQFSNIFLPFYEDYYKSWRRWSRPEDERLLINMMLPYVFACDLEETYNIRYIDSNFELTKQEEESYKYEKDFFLKNKNQVAFMDIVQNFQHMYTISHNKIQALIKLLNQIVANKEKVIIYIKFLDEIIFFKESGFLSGFSFVECTGSSNKRKAIAKFEGNVDIMFCTYGVDQLDLNLELCNNIIFFSQTFDYKCKIQSLYNLYYTQYQKPVTIYNFWVKTGLEELIRQNLLRKANVLSNVCKMISKNEAMTL